MTKTITGKSSGGAGAIGAEHDGKILKQRLVSSDSDGNTAIGELLNRINRAPAGKANCAPNPPDGFPAATSQRFYYLSQIVGPDIPVDSPECGATLACFLDQIVAAQQDPDNNPPQVHSGATLIVDRNCVVTRTLTVPNRFTLTGVGPDGEGRLVFDLPDNASALRFAPANGVEIRMSSIRDINISGAGCCGQVGINVSNSQLVYIDRVRLTGFAFGLFGEDSFAINVTNCNIHDNGFNVMMGENTTTWRLRDSYISAGLVGVAMMPTARAHVVSGAIIERNLATGVWINGAMNVIESSWFEGNGTLPPAAPSLLGVRITGLAQKTRVLSNVFSSQLIGNAGAETKRCFNMSFAAASADVNEFRCR